LARRPRSLTTVPACWPSFWSGIQPPPIGPVPRIDAEPDDEHQVADVDRAGAWSGRAEAQRPAEGDPMPQRGDIRERPDDGGKLGHREEGAGEQEERDDAEPEK